MSGTVKVEMDIPRFPAKELVAFAAAAFVGAGLTEESALSAAEMLIIADRRGVESHGLARLAGYLGRLKAGLIDARAEVTVDRETPSSLVVNGNNGLGLLVGPVAMRRCIEKAESAGVCICTVRESNHFGIAGTYAKMAAEQGMIGMAMTNASRTVVPMYAKSRMIGTNPIAIAAPTGNGRPFLLDMSTSAVAWGKIELARRAGVPIPDGWAVDEDGVGTNDPMKVNGLLPLGSNRTLSGHKGYGLGMFVDIMCAMLSGNSWSYDIASSTSRSKSSGIGHAFMAWRIDAFRDPEDFLAEMDAMIAQIREAEVSDAAISDRVLIPGDPEAEAEERNDQLGIPIRREVLAELKVAVDELGVPFTLVV